MRMMYSMILSDSLLFPFPTLPFSLLHFGMSAPSLLVYQLCCPFEFYLHSKPLPKRKINPTPPPLATAIYHPKLNHPFTTLARYSGVDETKTKRMLYIPTEGMYHIYKLEFFLKPPRIGLIIVLYFFQTERLHGKLEYKY